jgi:hypothetical protein
MQDITAQVQHLLDEAEQLPTTPAKLAILQEAVRIADTHDDIDLGIEARRPLMIVARNLMRGDILAVAFTWCLAHYDREPQRFRGRDLLWEQKMVIGQLANLDDVSRATLENLLDDLGRRLQAAGLSLREMYVTQRSFAADLGDRSFAVAAGRAIRQLSRNHERSNSLQDRIDEIASLVFVGEEDRALKLGLRLLNSREGGHLGCETAYGPLLLPLLKRKRIAEAVRVEQRCRREYHPERCYYWWHGDVLKWLTLTNKLGRAVRVYEECQRAINSFTDPLTRLHFALDASVLFDRLRQSGPRELTLRLPELVPVPHEDGRYRVEELHAWLHAEAHEWTERFDRRNGNSYFREQIQERSELQRWAIGDPDTLEEFDRSSK